MRSIAKTCLIASALMIAAASTAQAGAVLDALRARNSINCGTHQSQPAFAYTDSAGKWHGFDAEFCAAVAAAVFGDASKVNYVPISFSQNFTSLQSGEVDIVSRSVTWTFSRDFDLGMTFVGVTLYGGPTVMVPKAANVKAFKDLNGASICMLGGSNNEAVLKEYFRTNNLQYKQVVFDDQKVMFAAYEAGRCDGAVTGPAILAAERSHFKTPANHIIINDLMAKDPQGPLVREGDSEWADVTRMTLAALIAAEELGVTSQNVKKLATESTDSEVRRLLNTEGNIGSRLGLKKGWAIDVIASVGNYGEMFERNVGQGSVLKLERGQNALWTHGGLMMAPPVR